MPIIPLKTCRNFDTELIYDYSNLCAGTLDGSIDACSLDAGEALIRSGEAVGIFTWGPTP